MQFELPQQEPLKLISYLKRHRGLFWLEAAGGIIYNTVIVTGPIILGKAIDAASLLINEGVTTARVQTLLMWCLLFVFSTIFFQFARYVKRRYIRKMCFHIRGDMRAGLMSRTLNKSMSDIERESVGDMMSRTVGDVEQIVSTIETTINEGWDTWLLMISYFVVLLFYNWKITLLCAIPIPFALFIAESARHPLYQYSLKSRQFASRVTSQLRDMVNSVAILRLYGKERAEKERLAVFAEEQVRWNIKTALLQSGMMPIYSFLASLGIVGAIGIGGQQVIDGVWSIGTFIAYFTMFAAMARRTWVAARVFNRWHAARASWQRIIEKLQTDEAARETEEQKEEPNQVDTQSKQGIYVNHMRFSYTNSSLEALRDINFSVPFGSIVGITGPVGSGKSALGLALTGLYPYRGKVSFGGVELSELSKAERTELIAYAGQDAFLFSASIADNVMFSNSEEARDPEKLKQVLHISALSDDMDLFPQGPATLIGERGVRVSGGQRQRIALARALYADKPIVVLDDPFSAVDIGTEYRIVERLRESLVGKTVFLFSHRLNSFPFLDHIIVLNDGEIAEQGTHDELMANQEIYTKIYNAQAWLEGDRHES